MEIQLAIQRIVSLQNTRPVAIATYSGGAPQQFCHSDCPEPFVSTLCMKLLSTLCQYYPLVPLSEGRRLDTIFSGCLRTVPYTATSSSTNGLPRPMTRNHQLSLMLLLRHGGLYELACCNIVPMTTVLVDSRRCQFLVTSRGQHGRFSIAFVWPVPSHSKLDA